MAQHSVEDTLLNLEKGVEGNVLALNAVADVLSKMDERLRKQEEKDEEEELEKMQVEKEHLEKQSLIKEILSELKKADAPLFDLHGDEGKVAEAKDKWPMDGKDTDDAETKPFDNDTEDAQKYIQAMMKELKALRKQMDDMASHWKEDEEEEEMEKGHHFMKDDDEEMMDMEEEGAAEYPMDEDHFDEEEIPPMDEEKAMYKQVLKQNNLLKQKLSKMGQDKDAEVKKGVESQLKKMGYRKETYNAPRIRKDSIGVPTNQMDLMKSSDERNPIEQLSDMSYAQLWNLYEARRRGSDELPKELYQ